MYYGEHIYKCQAEYGQNNLIQTKQSGERLILGAGGNSCKVLQIQKTRRIARASGSAAQHRLTYDVAPYSRNRSIISGGAPYTLQNFRSRPPRDLGPAHLHPPPAASAQL